MMRKYLFILMIPLVPAMSGHASDTSQAAGASASKAAQDNQALIALAAIGNTGDAAQTITVTTNKPAWENSILAGLSLTRGNSDTLLTTASFKTRKKTREDEFAFGADGSYGEDNSVKNNETLHGIGQFNHLFSDRFYGYLNAEGLHDGISDLEYRFTFSPGAGYYLIKETNATLAVEFGPGLITQRLGGVDTTY